MIFFSSIYREVCVNKTYSEIYGNWALRKIYLVSKLWPSSDLQSVGHDLVSHASVIISLSIFHSLKFIKTSSSTNIHRNLIVSSSSASRTMNSLEESRLIWSIGPPFKEQIAIVMDFTQHKVITKRRCQSCKILRDQGLHFFYYNNCTILS